MCVAPYQSVLQNSFGNQGCLEVWIFSTQIPRSRFQRDPSVGSWLAMFITHTDWLCGFDLPACSKAGL